jgi:RNA polymerase sigma factor (sigma-70 family)
MKQTPPAQCQNAMETDQLLLSRYAATCDAEAFAELVRRHRVMVFSTARRITGNHHDAEDVTQACFFELAKSADDIDGAIAGWLHTRATSRAINHLKSADARRTREEEATERERQAHVPDHVDLEWSEVAPFVDAAFEHLPDELREPLIMHFLEGRNYREIARELRLSKTTIERRIKIGIERLRLLISGKTAIPSTAALAVLLKQNGALATTPYLNGALAKLALAGVQRGGLAGLAMPAMEIPRDHPVVSWLIHLRHARFAMPGVIALLIVITGLIGWGWLGDARGGASSYDILRASHQPIISLDDPLAFPAKIRQLAGDRGRFAQGADELFYRWCGVNAADWLTGEQEWVTTHGDLSLDHVGVAVSALGPGRPAVGLSGFDDAATLPIQIELLRGLVNLRALADQQGVMIDSGAARELSRTLVDAFASGCSSPDRAEAELLAHPWFAELIGRCDRGYKEELQQYSADGRTFAGLVQRGPGGIKDVLERALDQRERAARIIARSVADPDAALGRVFRADAGVIRGAIRDVARRTHVDSVSSQGQEKLLVLLRGDALGLPHDLIVYIKQAVPGGAQRAGLASSTASSTARSEARRVVEASNVLRGVDPFLAACELDGQSYLVEVRTPWAGELNESRVRGVEDLLQAARIVGLAAGRAHHATPGIEASLTPTLAPALAMRMEACWIHLSTEYEDFRNDPRVRRDSRAASEALDQLLARVRTETKR